MRCRLLLSTCILTMGVAAPAFAQEAEADVTIIVTGQKANRSLLDTQSSVAVVTAADIEEKDLTSFREAFRTMGNVLDADFIDAGFVIRGVNSEGLTPGGAPLAAVYVDGAEQTVQGARRGSRGLWDVEQVEVYRGPQSTLSGRAALAGAIYINTRDPRYDWDASARVSVAELDTREGALAFGGPILADKIAFRIAGEYNRRDSEVNYPTFEAFNRFKTLAKDEYYQLRGKLLIEPMPDLRIVLSHAYAYDAPAYDDIAGPGFGFAYSDRRGDFNTPLFQEARQSDNYTTALESVYTLSDRVSITALSTLVDTTVDRSSVNAGTPGETNITTGEIDERLFTQELRGNLETGFGLTGVFGLYYAYNRSTAGFVRTAPFGGGRTDTSLAVNRSRSYAAFGEVTVPLSGRLKIVAGARVDHLNQQVASSTARDNVNPARPDTASSDLLRSSETTFLPKAGVIFEPSDSQRLSFIVQRGFRSGGATRNSATNTVTPYNPEYTVTYEGSYRKTFGGGRGNIGLNIFYTDWTDQQVEFDLVPGDFTSRVIVNAGKSRLFGGELEGRYSPVKDVDGFVSIGYVNTKFTDFSDPNLGDFTGLRFPESPRFTVATGIDYRPKKGFFAGVDAKYVGSYLARDLQSAPIDTVGNYFVANLRAGYVTPSWSLTVFADNILDERYFVYRDTIEVGDPAGPFDCCGTLGRSRVAGITGQIRF